VRGARLVMGLLALAVVGCSGAHHTTTDIISAGQVDIKLPPGWTVTAHGAVAPPSTAPLPSGSSSATTGLAAAGAGSPTTSPGSTIPLAKQDPTTEFFQATGAFTSCLKTNGVKFIGAPDPKNPSSPANSPDYIKSLTTCAAQSHIVQALKDEQASQANLTPAQIKTQNEGFLRWRDCMIGRGWTIPVPKPDSQGRLFSFSGGGGNGPQLTPPPGQDPLTSSDIRDCAAQTQQAAGSGGSAG
jgi:hypothetical protein